MADGRDLIKALMSAKTSKANVGDLIDAYWERFGGAQGLANLAFEQFEAAKKGSSAALNTLSTIFEQVGAHAARQAKEKQDQVENIDEAELAAVIQHVQRTLNAQEKPTPTELRPAAEPGDRQSVSPHGGASDDSQERPRDELAL